MRKRLALILLIGLLSLSLGAASPKTFEQALSKDDQKYAGLWVGTWINENGPTKGDISYTLSKGNKGQWRGTVNFKYRNQPEEYKADLLSLQIADGKMKAKFEWLGGKGGAREAGVEGHFQGDRLEGSLTISPKGSTNITSKWTWKTTKSTAAKPGQ